MQLRFTSLTVTSSREDLHLRDLDAIDLSVLPVLHTAGNVWFLVIQVMVRSDGSNLQPLQLVVSILV